MKRDMDLVRQLLLAVEDSDRGERRKGADVSGRAFDGATPDIVDRHLDMMEQKELIEQVSRQSAASFAGSGEMKTVVVGADTWRLTWVGHDFLDTIRDDNVWSKTKAAIGKVGGTTSLEAWKAVSSEVGKKAALAAASAAGFA